MLKTTVSLKMFITNKIIVTKILTTNEVDSVESGNKLIKKFIEPKNRKLSKVNNYLTVNCLSQEN